MVDAAALGCDGEMVRRLSPTLFALALACADADSQTTRAWEEGGVGSTEGGHVDGTTDTSGAPTPEDTTGAPEPDDDGSSSGAPLPDVPASDPCPRIRVVVPPDEPLNVRPDPSTTGDPIGGLGNGTIVDVVEQVVGEAVEGDTTWFHIPWQDGSGYVSGVFAECTLEEPPEPPDGYYLPLPCGFAANCTQGNMGATSHNGAHAYAFDFGVPLDTPLVAMADGVVALTYAETVPGDPCYDGGGPECGPSGNEVVLSHGDGTSSMYKHLNAVQVAVGDVVTRGQQIGLSGTTGYSTGPHVHVMRMESCGALTCQSIPLEFVEAGVPVTGTPVVSQNCP